MNRAQRRQIKKKTRDKAEDIWFLEMLTKMSSNEETRAKAMTEMMKITSECSDEELYLIDAYLTSKYGTPT